MPQHDRDYFKKQLEGLLPKAQAIIGLRAAMRALPVLSYRESGDTQPFAYWKEGERDQYALAIIRCYQASAFVNGLTNADSATDAYAAARSSATNAYAAAHSSAAYAAAFAADAAAYAAAPAAAAYAAYAASRWYAAEAYTTARSSTAYTAAAAADALAHAVDAYADNTAAYADVVSAILAEVERVRSFTPSRRGGQEEKEMLQQQLALLLGEPLWSNVPSGFQALWHQLQADLRSLDAGFGVWIDWYQDRLDGEPFDWEIERQCALLSKERLSQSPAEINAYLRDLRKRQLKSQLKRVRAIFIGHGEVGKTSLIRALHGEEVIEGQEAMTQGVTISAAIYEQAGVFTRVTDFKDDDLTVHFWDFGGQVMAHATHQFFLRSKCLYVIVLAGRSERNPNEEAEYWLEHVRAFGDNAPVLIVGNKADVMPISLDLQTLRNKYPNIIELHSLSCTQAKNALRKKFELFRDDFIARLQALGEQAERFSPAQFKALKTIEDQAAKDDFIQESGFDEICRANGIAMEGPGGRDSLLDIFDKLGIVMHFRRLNFLADYVLNPRWFTYGVYTLMYSEEAKAAKGRLSEADLVAILKKANTTILNCQSCAIRRTAATSSPTP